MEALNYESNKRLFWLKFNSFISILFILFLRDYNGIYPVCMSGKEKQHVDEPI